MCENGMHTVGHTLKSQFDLCVYLQAIFLRKGCGKDGITMPL